MSLSLRSTTQLDDQAFRSELEGGPLVLSERIDSMRSVGVGLWVRWGASHDAAEQMGAAHLLEHMIFKGTQRRSARQIALEIEGLGGSLDAYTSREHTACQARVLDEHLPIALDVLSDLVFRPLLREQDLALERNVILEEIAGVEDTPEELVFDLHARALWGEHPYGSPVLGTAETVGAITRDDLQRLWRSAYRPQLSVVAAVGNLRHEELLELVTTRFPRESGAVPPPELGEPPKSSPGDHWIERDSAQVHVCLGAPLFPRSDDRRYGAMLVSTSLGGGMSSRLFQRVREELGLVYAIYSFQSYYARAGMTGIYMATRTGVADQAVAEVRAELDRLAGAGLPSEELAAVKSQTKGQVILSLDSSTSRLQRLAGSALYDEPYLTLDEISARVDAVTEDEVAELCRAYYAPEAQVIVRLGPDGREPG